MGLKCFLILGLLTKDRGQSRPTPLVLFSKRIVILEIPPYYAVTSLLKLVNLIYITYMNIFKFSAAMFDKLLFGV